MVALPGGGSAKVFLRGDELLNWHEDEQGYALVRNAGEGWVYAEYVGEGVFKATKYALGEANPAEAGIARPDYSQLRAFALEKEEERAAAAPPTRAPLTGTMRNLVILVNFTDLRIQSDVPDPVPAFDALFNQPGYHMDGAVGSVRDYYHEISYNRLTVESTVVGPVTTNYGYAYYPFTIFTPREMVTEALAKLDQKGFDFSTMDGDGDGWVDGLTIIHAGGGAEYVGNDPFYIWSHQWELLSPVTYDGVQMQMYHTEPARRGWDDIPASQGITRIGVICHENGHFLGLPDLYDRDYTSAGVGEFCLMSGGSWNGPNDEGEGPAHMSAWCKTQLGWVTPTVVNTTGTYTVNQSATNRSIYKLQGAFTANEYFLLENRYAAGFDTWLPGTEHGILIWHVDESVRETSQNDDETHFLVDLEEADGVQDLQESPYALGDDSDYFRGGFSTVFSSVSSPNNRSYTGTPLGIDVIDVSNTGPSMQFTLGAPAICTLAVESTPNDGVAITGTCPGVTTYGVSVLEGCRSR